ncbi:hypothetical protein FA15DRAFT_610811 [Coprinopsis marcescibilis]|uniref:Uncharacterized protein n=1 Tax=Coprinopsis marcescibilis TaxID=230819 RepID=A0A5C3L8P1_COPMA|nr:hypothetical protein FA15DRAFT_610811 [Coprinopsis marcescibilis]
MPERTIISPPAHPTRTPPNMFTLVSSSNHLDYTVHCLWREGGTVVFQCNLKNDLGLPQNFTRKDLTFAVYQESFRFGYYALGIIQSLLNSIELDNVNWVYINKTADGYRILPRKRSFRSLIKCPLWSKLIYENEVQITRWNSEGANGYWNGKPVDLWYGWDQTRMRLVNLAMEAAQAVKDLDLTYEVYGHLLNSDGHVIGLVTEATWGRPIDVNDRTIVYEAISRLQRHFCIFSNAGTSGLILIAGGKVRLADLCSIKYYPPDQRSDWEELTDRVHWRGLEEVFANLEEGFPPMPHYQLYSSVPLTFCPNSPYPERPIRPTVLCYMHFTYRSEYDQDDSESHWTVASRRNRQHIGDELKLHKEVYGEGFELAPVYLVTCGNQHWVITIAANDTQQGKARRLKFNRHTEGQSAKPCGRTSGVHYRRRFRSVGSDYTSEEGSVNFEEMV